MPALYITEFSDEANASDGRPMQAVQTPSIGTQTVAIGGASAQSAAFKSNTRIVRINTDMACHVVFGANPVATTSMARMSADQTEYFGVVPGQKIAVIQGA